MKICTRCNESKGLSEYHRDTGKPSGYAPHCKQCHKKLYPVRAWNKTKKGKESAIKAAKAWAGRNREKTNAHSNLNYHLKKGNITKPIACQCCGNQAKLDAHHRDYSKPLSVEWLCRPCHKAAHSP